MSEITDKRNLIQTLKEIKENLSWDNEKNYYDIINACTDCDNEYGEPYLVDYIYGYDFVNDDDMRYLIERADNDIDRLRCFIGNTYSDTIYKLDGYGNLQNVDSGDFECLCDELIDMLRENVKELQNAEMR